MSEDPLSESLVMDGKPLDVETWVRNLVAWLFIVISVGILGILLVATALVLRFLVSQKAAARFGDFTCNWWSKGLCLCYGIKVDVHGLEHIPKNEALVIATNHRSHVDIPAIVMALFSNVRFGFVLKKSLLKVPLWGWFLHAIGYIPIDRKARGQDQLKIAKERIKEGRSVCIFVEGTRSTSHAFGRFKKGAAVLALDAGVSILPVTMSGTGVLMPKSKWFVRPGKVRVDVHALISTDELGFDARNRLTKELEGVIASEYRIDLEGPTMKTVAEPSRS